MKKVRIWSFSGPYFPELRLNTERYSVTLRIQSECGKIRTRKTPNTDTFLAVYIAKSDAKKYPHYFSLASVKASAPKTKPIQQKDEETELDVVELMRCLKADTDDLFYICINNIPKLEKHVLEEVIKTVERSKKVKHLSLAMTGIIDADAKVLLCHILKLFLSGYVCFSSFFGWFFLCIIICSSKE